jgi:hypothetical protein
VIDQVSRKANAVMGRLRGVVVGLAGAMAARDAFGFTKQLEDLSIASGGAMGSLKAVSSRVLEVSDDTSVAKEQLVAAASAFVAITGDGKAAGDALQTFGRVAFATGSDAKEIGLVAATLSQNLGVLPGQFEQAFSTLAAQGKAGAVELKDMASLLPSIGAQFAQFGGGKGISGLAEMGGALQVVRRGFGSAGQAGTAFERLLAAVQRGATKLASKGINVYGADGKTLRNFRDLVGDIASKKFKGTELFEILGSKEAKGAFDQLAKGTAVWDDLTKSTQNATDVGDDYAKRQAFATAKISKLWNRTKNLITRAFAEIIDMGAKLIDHLDKLVLSIGALGIAFGLLRIRAVGAALATVAAWAAVLVPVALLGAALIGLALLYEGATGRDAFADMERVLDFVLGKLKAVYAWAKKIIDEFSTKTASLTQIAGSPGKGVNLGERGLDTSGKSIGDAYLRAATVIVSRMAAAEHAIDTPDPTSAAGVLGKAFGFGGSGTFPMYNIPGYRESKITEVAGALRSSGITPATINNTITIEGDADREKVERGVTESMKRSIVELNK